jgi:type II secretory pathway component GspD/PulD (secretin)
MSPRTLAVVALLFTGLGSLPARAQAPSDKVAVEVRLVSVSEGFAEMAERLGGLKLDFSPGTVTYLNDLQLFTLFEVVQGDRRSSVLQAPKMTAASGQSTSLEIADVQYFVTNVDMVQHNSHSEAIPKNEPVKLGLELNVCPTVAADHRNIDLALKINHTELASENVTLFPVTSFITPVFEGGAQGQPIPFTQFIQQPQFNKMSLERTVNIPDGSTAFLGGWKRSRETRTESTSGPAFVAKVPYISELFKNVSYSRENEMVLLLVTARLINDREEQASLPPSAATMKDMKRQVTDLLDRYDRACAAGRLAEAKDLASQAISLNPECFQRQPVAQPKVGPVNIR